MPKNIVITGSTDGIGLQTARALLHQGHRVLLHGRDPGKLSRLQTALAAEFDLNPMPVFAADLSELAQVRGLATAIGAQGLPIDVLINNAGVFKVPSRVASNGTDIRYVVNTIAPWLLTRELHGHLARDARVINLSSAAQAPVDLDALRGLTQIDDDFSAYAQSKLALTMWSMEPDLLGLEHQQSLVAVNPGSLLGSKMVRDGFGTPGKDINIGVWILTHLALEPGAVQSGHYFDNDAGRYAAPHPDAADPAKRRAVCEAIAEVALPD